MNTKHLMLLALLLGMPGLAGCSGSDENTDNNTNPDSDTDADSDSDIDADSDSDTDTDSDTDDGPAMRLPPANASWDYQIGGAYPPPSGVAVVSRDRSDSPAPGLYNICYVNGFQTQPHEEQWWLTEHPDLILRDTQGNPVADEDWGELLFDTTSETKRARLADIVGEWIDGCARDGFDAVEIDNLDSYSRSGGRVSEDENVAFMALLGLRGHAAGLAMGQKNSAEILRHAGEMGTDFAVAEECNQWNECGDYQEVYGDLVFIIEYRQVDFDRGCADFPELSIVYRDINVTTPASGAYIYDGC